jgi:hypothetical protein
VLPAVPDTDAVPVTHANAVGHPLQDHDCDALVDVDELCDVLGDAIADVDALFDFELDALVYVFVHIKQLGKLDVYAHEFFNEFEHVNVDELAYGDDDAHVDVLLLVDFILLLDRSAWNATRASVCEWGRGDG